MANDTFLDDLAKQKMKSKRKEFKKLRAELVRCMKLAERDVHSEQCWHTLSATTAYEQWCAAVTAEIRAEHKLRSDAVRLYHKVEGLRRLRAGELVPLSDL